MRPRWLQPGPIGLIVLVAIGVRLAAGAWFEARLPAGQTFEFGDSDGYWHLAAQIAAGKPYQYHSADAQVFRMPGYPVLLAPLFLVFGPDVSPVWGRALSAVLGGATVGLIAWWGTLLFDRRAGLLAGWIAAFYPGAVAMSAFILSEAPFMPLMVAHLALATVAFQASTPRRRMWFTLAAGLAAAGAIYMRPSWLLFPPFAFVVGLLSATRWKIAAQQLTMFGVICLCLLPWWVRNYRVTGSFVPTSLQIGASLYDGLNPQADGSSNFAHLPTFEPVTPLDPTAELPVRQLLQATFPDGATRDLCCQRSETLEVCQNRLLRDLAVEWALAHPKRVLHLAAVKFSRMWNMVPNEAMFGTWTVKLGVALTYLPVLFAGLLGLALYGRLGWPYVLPFLPAIYFTLLHTLFVSSIRYREPAMAGLIVLAGGAVSQLLLARKERQPTTAFQGARHPNTPTPETSR